MPPKKKPSTTPKPPTPITALKHKDKRANIPTEELRDFVSDDEKQPKTVLYPRDPSLDPQLVWQGKDEQDRADLAVPAVPIYTTPSRPFDPPQTGKLAVKVINHYGDEVLKVFELRRKGR